MKKRDELKSPGKNTDPTQDLHEKSFSRIILIDFDGVLHQYSQGWKGPGVIYDPPVPGSLVWLRGLIEDERFEPAIYSSRSKSPAGMIAMRRWLREHGLGEEELDKLEFPIEKPAAWLTIDDRCFLFRGQWPTKDFMLGFMGWTKRPELVKQVNGEDVSDAMFLRYHADGDVPHGPTQERLLRIANELDGQT